MRPMQRLGLLMDILPEFAVIDSLVVRDFYHRYTVDEHTLRTIEHCKSWPIRQTRAGQTFLRFGRRWSGGICWF